MVPTVSKTQVQAPPAASLSRASGKRWPLAVSIFGALAASAVLWAAIFFAFRLAMGLVTGEQPVG